MIKIEDLRFSYGKKLIFDGLSTSFEDSSFTALCGSSGVGKTTLFNLISGLLKPSEGRIIGAEDGVVYMFQENRLIPSITAWENIAAVLSPSALRSKLGKNGGKEAALELLDRLNISDAAELLPEEMSGGMKRRLALARAAAMASFMPHLPVLLDEPFKGLDGANRRTAMEFSRKTFEGRTVIVITHDKEEEKFCDIQVNI